MNRLWSIAFVLISSIAIFAQSELKIHNNGLIYSSSTMSKLDEIVDSLNLKFLRCDLDKVYYSKCQTVASFIEVKGSQAHKAKRDMNKGISFDSLVSRYPDANVVYELLVVKYQYTDHRGVQYVEFSDVSIGKNRLSISIKSKIQDYDGSVENTWVHTYKELSKYGNESVKGLYFRSDFKTTSIEPRYSQMVAYADCLVDTTITKFKDDATRGSIDLPRHWRTMSIRKKIKLLEEFRSTRVVGFCSMDNRPRKHAVNIAHLSAETANWEVFLRAHLDIMNDRFDRVSDGSYAWEGRRTYVRELEELDINILDLLVGITLRMENAAKNHYYSSARRIGRAIADSEQSEILGTQILSMIEDDLLDDYNRVIMYYVYSSYCAHIDDKNIRETKLELLAQSVESLPEYLINLE
ncbi:MAG: hypothetical protein JXR19_06670 [Bacteroidia bacterium]